MGVTTTTSSALTYVPIATTTLSGSAATYTFSSIPSTYTDLVIIGSITNATSGNGLYGRFNGDSGNNYSINGISADRSANANGSQVANTSFFQLGFHNVGAGTLPYPVILEINNYANTSTYKNVVSRLGDGSLGEVSSFVGSWHSTAAINSITLAGAQNFSTNTFGSGTTLTLYGILAA